MVFRYQYSEWDGSQDIPPLDPDDILAGLSDDLLNFGDLQHALRNLLQQLRQKRRAQLDKYDLSSVFEDIQKKLEEIVDMERETVDRRLGEATQQIEGGESPMDQFDQALQDAQEKANTKSGKQAQDDADPEEQKRLSEMLKNIAEKKHNFLENLPDDVGGKVKELQQYEFMDPEASAKFQELMEMLKKTLMDTFFKDLQAQIANLSPEDMARMKEMLRDLNKMMSEKMAGGEPDFDGFMNKYGDLFGDNPPKDLDELIQNMQQGIAAMQSLLDSLPPEARRQLQDLLMDKVGDSEMQRELNELAINLDILAPTKDLENQYPFRGDEDIDLYEAMKMMTGLQDLDELERQLEATQYGGELDGIDVDKLRDQLGEEAAETLDQLKQFLDTLEEAGYIRRKGNNWELTPRGLKKLGEKALGEIYQQLKKSNYGKHQHRGGCGQRLRAVHGEVVLL